MMKRLKYAAIGILAALPFVAGVAVAHAQSFRSGTNVTVAAGQVVNETLFAWGRTIDIAGTVNGDVFCGGQNITISGTVNGDVICAGQDIEVTAKVSGDVRVAGQDISINGPISGNLTAAGQSITTHDGGTVKGDVTVAGTDSTLNGAIGRDLAGTGHTVTVNAQVGRNLTANVNQLALGGTANIGGSVSYTSSNNLTREHSASVHGSITRNAPKPAGHVRPGAIIPVNWGWALYVFVSLLLLALVLVLLVPRAFHVASETARRHLLRTFLVGLVASIVVPVILIALLFTVVAIPLALLGGLVWLLIVMLSGPFAAYLLGRLLLRDSTGSAIWTMLLGAAVLLILYFVPFLGVLTSLLALWFGVGTILLQAVRLPRLHYNMKVEPARRA